MDKFPAAQAPVLYIEIGDPASSQLGSTDERAGPHGGIALPPVPGESGAAGIKACVARGADNPEPLRPAPVLPFARKC